MIPREPKPSRASAPGGARPQATLETSSAGDAAIVHVSGLVDEHFPGFGDVGAIKTVIVNLAIMGMANYSHLAFRLESLNPLFAALFGGRLSALGLKAY